MEKDVKKYEIGFLVREEADIEAIKKVLHSNKAEIKSEGRPRKIKLAYPIKKEVSAWFGYIWFEADPILIKAISDKLRLTNEVLRTIIINLPLKNEQPVDLEKKSEKPQIKSREKVEKPITSSDMVDNELLEKKLEEILK